MTVVAAMQPQAAGSSSSWHRFNATVCGVLFVFVYLYCVDVAYVVSANTSCVGCCCSVCSRAWRLVLTPSVLHAVVYAAAMQILPW